MGGQSVLSGRGDLLWMCMVWFQRRVAVRPACPASSSCIAAVIFFVCTCLAANQSAAHKEGGCRTPLHMQACQNFVLLTSL
jgi:hypothetical protein